MAVTYSPEEFKERYGDFGETHWDGGIITVENNTGVVYKNGKLTLEFSFIYHDNCYVFHGKITLHAINDTVVYHVNRGKLHREDGPAVIRTNLSGKVWCSRWYYEGQLYKPMMTKAARSC
tara:strand:- start:1187 stop:1546 length:360 start_codon:yes stop_codon:yes gene_type:complete